MQTKKILLSSLVAAGIAFSLNINNTQAATIQTPIQGTSYVKKGNTYKLHLKVPGKVTINTKAKYTIINTSSWKCIPYSGSTKNSKVFYLRAGNYKLTSTNSKNTKIKTSFTKLTKLKKTLDDYPIEKNELTSTSPDKIKVGQKVKGFLDMFKTYKFSGFHYYKFTIDKPQKITVNLSTMPVYELSKTNIFSDTSISIKPDTDYSYNLDSWRVKGKVSNKKNVWYLAKGTYLMDVNNLRGRFNFKLTGTDTDQVPAQNEISNITTTEDGLKVDYTKSDNANKYVIYYEGIDTPYSRSLITTKEDTLTQLIDKQSLVNGATYNLAVRPGNDKACGELSKIEKYTYYAPLAKDAVTPEKPVLTTNYYDDNGNDEPYISLKWNKNDKVDSYEVAYRVKGSNDWHTYFTSQSNWDELDNSTNKNDALYFKKGKTYELKVRALTGNLKSDWSDVKTETVAVTPITNQD